MSESTEKLIQEKYDGDRTKWLIDLGMADPQTGERYPLYCFIGETQIFTNKGFVQIKDCSVGDSVYSYNSILKKVELNTIVNIITKDIDQLYQIEIKGESFYATGKHPFFVKDLGWVEVSNLKEGDKLMMMNGEYITIKSINKIIKRVVVYNLTIEGNKNYFIGVSKILVHNK
jgi:hypothetical protein